MTDEERALRTATVALVVAAVLVLVLNIVVIYHWELL